MLLSESLRVFVEDYIWLHGYAKDTEDNYRWAINSIVKATGDIPLESITNETIKQWRHWMEAQQYESNAIINFLYKIRKLLEFFSKRLELQLDPSEIIIPKRKQSLPKVLTIEEIQRIITIAPLREKAILALLYSSGIRVGELCRLRKKDMLGDSIKIRGKGGKERMVPFMDVEAQSLLNEYQRSRTDSNQFLFYSQKTRGIGVARVEKLVHSLGVQAGIEMSVTPHVFRHSYATHKARAGISPYHLQKLLGHAHVSTTQIYVHLNDNDARAAYAQFHTPLNIKSA